MLKSNRQKKMELSRPMVKASSLNFTCRNDSSCHNDVLYCAPLKHETPGFSGHGARSVRSKHELL